jgi:hypothetical protein
MKRLKGFLGVILIWFFGLICGMVVAGGIAHARFLALVEGGPQKIVDVVVERLKNDLKLDDQQKEMLQHIALDTRIKLSAIRSQTQPQVDAALAEATERVRGILNPAQTKKFDEIIRKGRQTWKAHEPQKAPPAANPPPSSPIPAAVEKATVPPPASTPPPTATPPSPPSS